MNIRYLLKSQSNQILEAIRAAQCDPAEFEWQDTQGQQSGMTVSKLVHTPSGTYYFTFDNYQGFYSKWSPGAQTVTDQNGTGNWSAQLQWFREWLSYLKRETESPDLWTEISKGARILESAASSETSNAPFDAGEKANILKGLNEIKQYLLTAHKIDPELVESRLEYLIESSERLGRKDWLNLLVSVLVSIIISAALPPESTRELFRFVGSVLRQILEGPPLLLTS
ncbi:MAG TPA: hypothetical protein DC047_01215 [Blastocatellia bacterium]|nr:hypothetical protein [Blastocatellia bacterium]